MISVVIPAYNSSSFLERAVQSVLDQKEVSEILIVDDGSTDNTLELIKKIERQEERVRVLTHLDGRNLGAGASRNLGCKEAKSELIAFLDSDDYFLKDRFKKDLEILENTDVDGCYNATGTVFLDEEGAKRFQTMGMSENYLTTLTENISPEDLFWMLSPIGGKGYFHINGLTIKKNAFLKVGGFNEYLLLSQDTHFALKLALKTRLTASNIKEAVAMRGVHRDNRIRDKEKMESFRPFLFKDLLEWTLVEGVSKNKRNRLLRYFLIWDCKKGSFGFIGTIIRNWKYIFYREYIRFIYRSLMVKRNKLLRGEKVEKVRNRKL